MLVRHQRRACSADPVAFVPSDVRGSGLGEGVEVEADDYERYVQRSRLRFKRVVRGLVFGALALLYLPWGLVAARVMTSSTAEVVTCSSAFLILCGWGALLMKMADPRDTSAPGPDQRAKLLKAQVGTGGALLGTLLVLAALSWLIGWIELRGVGWAIGLAVILTVQAVRALFVRALRGG